MAVLNMESPFEPAGFFQQTSTLVCHSIQAANRLEKALRLPQMSLSLWWTDGMLLSKRALACLAKHRVLVGAYFVVTVLIISLLMFNDLTLLQAIRHEGVSAGIQQWHHLANLLSYWGDFMGYNMLIFISLGLAVQFRGSAFFRRLLIAVVIGTVICGAVANVSRFITGRARPSSRGKAGFHGPTFRSSQQSFPSAHTATAFGASVPVAIALPPVGLPLLFISAGVSWSRMENNRHFPSDVMTSIAFAFFVGVPLGLVVRRARRMDFQRRRTRTTASVQLDLAPLKPSIT